MAAIADSSRNIPARWSSPVAAAPAQAVGTLRRTVDLVESVPARLLHGVQYGVAGALAAPAAGALAVGTGITAAMVAGPCITVALMSESTARRPDYMGVLVSSGFFGTLSVSCVALGATALVAWPVTALAGGALGASYGLLKAPERD